MSEVDRRCSARFDAFVESGSHGMILDCYGEKLRFRPDKGIMENKANMKVEVAERNLVDCAQTLEVSWLSDYSDPHVPMPFYIIPADRAFGYAPRVERTIS